MKIDHCTALVQLLKDAGCNPEIIHQFLSAMEKGRTEENLHLLYKHRQQLITAIHKDQKQLDVLDFLIYTLKNHEKEC